MRCNLLYCCCASVIIVILHLDEVVEEEEREEEAEEEERRRRWMRWGKLYIPIDTAHQLHPGNCTPELYIDDQDVTI